MSCYSLLSPIEKIKIRKRLGIADARTAADMLYLAAVVLYVLRVSFDTTLFHIPWPSGYLVFLRISLCLVILLKAGCTKIYYRKKWILCILSFIVFKYSWLSTGYDFLLDTALLAIGAAGVPYRKVLKAGFWTGLYVLLLAMMGSFTGCIKDLVYLNDGFYRHSFGIVYPTDFAAHVVFLFLAGWVLYNGASNMRFVVYALGLGVVVFYYNGALCSTIALGLSALGIFYTALAEKYKERFRTGCYITKFVEDILIYVVLFCALFMIIITLLYNTENEMIIRINSLLSNRLRYGKAAMEKYGFTFFGTAFSMQGYGGDVTWTGALEYSFVDSSYILIMVRYGIAALAAICIQSVYMGRMALHYKQRKLLLAFVIVAVHSMIEHHLPETAYNLFLLLPFADFTYDKSEEKAFSWKRNDIITYIAVLAAVITAIALLPRFVTYIETIVKVLRLDMPEKHIHFIGMITGFMLWIYMLIRLFSQIIAALGSKAPLGIKTFVWGEF